MHDVDLLPGTLDLIVLHVLAHGPKHGYDVARFVREHSEDKFRVIDGALYASLHRLEKRGHVTSHWGHSVTRKRAKYYQLTPAGRRAFRVEATRWFRYIAGVAKIMTVRLP
jgi:transcriptional regulator